MAARSMIPDKLEFRATLFNYWLIINLALVASRGAIGRIDTWMLFLSLLALPVVFLGNYLGQKIAVLTSTDAVICMLHRVRNEDRLVTVNIFKTAYVLIAAAMLPFWATNVMSAECEEVEYKAMKGVESTDTLFDFRVGDPAIALAHPV